MSTKQSKTWRNSDDDFQESSDYDNDVSDSSELSDSDSDSDDGEGFETIHPPLTQAAVEDVSNDECDDDDGDDPDSAVGDAQEAVATQTTKRKATTGTNPRPAKRRPAPVVEDAYSSSEECGAPALESQALAEVGAESEGSDQPANDE